MAFTTQMAEATTLQLTSRRREQRTTVDSHSKATAWTGSEKPSEAVVIEADRRGARLVINGLLQAEQSVRVSFSNELGFHHTKYARVAWAEYLPLAGRTIVGVGFFGCN